MRQLFILLLLFVSSSSFSQMMPEKFSDFYSKLAMSPYDERLQKIDKAIKKKPNEPWYYWMKAETYKMMGDETKTLENFYKSLAIDSNFSAGHGSLARYMYFIENAKLSEALIHINKAIKLEPEMHYYYIDRGNIYLLSKEYDLAIADANKLISEEVHQQDAVKLIIETLNAQAKKDDLKAYLLKFDLTSFGGFMDTDFDTLLGDLYLEFDDKEKACKSYNSAAEPYLRMRVEVPAEIAKKLEQCK